MKNKSLLILISTLVLGIPACGPKDTTPKENTYTVTWLNYNGTVLETDNEVKEGSMPHYDGIDPVKPDDNDYTYTWNGWTPELAVVTSDQTYTATFSSSAIVHTYTITYILNGGTNSPSNPSTYTEGASFTFADAQKNGYSFAGWYDANGNKITGVNENTKGNLTLSASWTAILNTLSVTSEDDSKGTVAITSGSGYSGESITVKATPAEEYKFDGWYNGQTKKSNDATYTFTMPANDYSLVARFSYDEERAIRLGKKPNLSQDGKTLTYGLYPQKNVNTTDLITELNKLDTPESNGWYLYNDAYYAKLVATPNNTYYEFDNGTKIVSGTTYWFKCDLITWNVLSNGDNYYVLSSVLLDAHCFYNSQERRVIDGYQIKPNNYEYSDIRTWLNDDFYNTAFSLSKSYIVNTKVDNSAKTTNEASSYICNDTDDNVFLPSYQDYMNTNYGFVNDGSSSLTRKCKTTDWARARGVYYYNKSNQFYSPYWTRSPYRYTYNTELYTSTNVDSTGCMDDGDVTLTSYAVRPAIYLDLD